APTTGRVSRTVDSADWEITETPFAAAVRHADGTAFPGRACADIFDSTTTCRTLSTLCRICDSITRNADRHRPGRERSAPSRRRSGPADAASAWLGQLTAETAIAWPGQRPRPAQSVRATAPWAPRSASTLEWLTKG